MTTQLVDSQNLIYKKPSLLNDTNMHYCPGCSHGVVHKVIAEVIEDMDIADRMRRDAENNFAEIRTRQEPAEWEDITDVYWGIEYGSGDYEE